MSMKLSSTQFTKDSLKYFQNMEALLLPRDFVLMLLFISPVKGTTILQKQIFLAWKTIFAQQSHDLGFYSYKFGAYSTTIADSIKILESLKLIRIKNEKKSVRYFITPLGKRVITKKLKKMNINLDKLKIKKLDWNEWDTRAIMKFIYRNYPEYTTQTEVPSLKW